MIQILGINWVQNDGTKNVYNIEPWACMIQLFTVLLNSIL
jgi:hypothetical protein